MGTIWVQNLYLPVTTVSLGTIWVTNDYPSKIFTKISQRYNRASYEAER